MKTELFAPERLFTIHKKLKLNIIPEWDLIVLESKCLVIGYKLGTYDFILTEIWVFLKIKDC